MFYRYGLTFTKLRPETFLKAPSGFLWNIKMEIQEA